MGDVADPTETALVCLVNAVCVGCHFPGAVEAAEPDVALLRPAVFRVRLDALEFTSWPKAVAMRNKRVIETAKVFSDVKIGSFNSCLL